VRLMRFFAQRTRSTRDMRTSQESVHGLQVPGTNPGTRANSEVPSEIKSIGNPRQVKNRITVRSYRAQGQVRLRTRISQANCAELGIEGKSGEEDRTATWGLLRKYPSKENIDRFISLSIKTRSSYAAQASVRPEDVGT